MTTLRLAIKELLDEKVQVVCIVALIAAIAAPIMLLLSVKTGVMETLVGELRKNPEMRQLYVRGNNEFGNTELETIRGWAQSGFVVPEARSLARRLQMKRPGGRKFFSVTLVPTAAGDPLLPADTILSEGEVAVSARLGRVLELQSGDVLTAYGRRGNPPTALLRRDLRVAYILPVGALGGWAVLMNADEIDRIEAFYDGYALPKLGVPNGRDPSSRPASFESFRIFATDIADVAELEVRLETLLGVQVMSQAGKIGSILDLSKNLALALAVLVVVGLVGLAIALASLFWSTVQRKKLSLSLLALMGMGPRDLAAIPVIQALICALAGSLLTLTVAIAGAFATNMLFADRLPRGSAVAVVHISHLLVVSATICLVSIAASLVAARVAARSDPAAVIRSGGS